MAPHHFDLLDYIEQQNKNGQLLDEPYTDKDYPPRWPEQRIVYSGVVIVGDENEN